MSYEALLIHSVNLLEPRPTLESGQIVEDNPLIRYSGVSARICILRNREQLNHMRREIVGSHRIYLDKEYPVSNEWRVHWPTKNRWYRIVGVCNPHEMDMVFFVDVMEVR